MCLFSLSSAFFPLLNILNTFLITIAKTQHSNFGRFEVQPCAPKITNFRKLSTDMPEKVLRLSLCCIHPCCINTWYAFCCPFFFFKLKQFYSAMVVIKNTLAWQELFFYFKRKYLKLKRRQYFLVTTISALLWRVILHILNKDTNSLLNLQGI